MFLIALAGAVSISHPNCKIPTLKIGPVVCLQPHSVIGYQSSGQEGGEIRAACGHLLHTLGWDGRSVLMPLIRTKLRQGTPWWLRQQQAAPFIKLMGFIFLTLAIYQRRRRRDGGRKRDQIPRRLQQLGGGGLVGEGGGRRT